MKQRPHVPARDSPSAAWSAEPPAADQRARETNLLNPALFLPRTFNFDADQRWQSYRQRLELPAGSDEASVLQRMKQKWYKREIDPSFDAGQGECVWTTPWLSMPQALKLVILQDILCAVGVPLSTTAASRGATTTAPPPPSSAPPPPPPQPPAGSALPASIAQAWNRVYALIMQMVGKMSGTASSSSGSGATSGTGGQVCSPHAEHATPTATWMVCVIFTAEKCRGVRSGWDDTGVQSYLPDGSDPSVIDR